MVRSDFPWSQETFFPPKSRTCPVLRLWGQRLRPYIISYYLCMGFLCVQSNFPEGDREDFVVLVILIIIITLYRVTYFIFRYLGMTILKYLLPSSFLFPFKKECLLTVDYLYLLYFQSFSSLGFLSPVCRLFFILWMFQGLMNGCLMNN